MKRRTLFAALFGAASLALPVKAQSKNTCPVCGVGARTLKVARMKRGYVTQHVVIGGDDYGVTTTGLQYAMHPVYDREPVVAHRNEAGEIDWFLEDCQRCGCVFKVAQPRQS